MVRKVTVGDALIGGEPDAAAEGEEEHVPMFGEDRSEHPRLVWPYRNRASIAAVVEQYGREWSTTVRAPQQCAQPERAALDHDCVGLRRRLAVRRNREPGDRHERQHEDARVHHVGDCTNENERGSLPVPDCNGGRDVCVRSVSSSIFGEVGVPPLEDSCVLSFCPG